MRPSIDEFELDGPALGLLEIAQVAPGLQAADRVVKAAAVELLLATPVTPGKYLVLFSGDVAAVSSALQAGEHGITELVLDRLLLPQAHPGLGRAVGESRAPAVKDSIGIVEAARISTLLGAADAAAKAGQVELVCIRLAMRLDGKAFFVVGGEVSQVSAAVERAVSWCQSRGHFVAREIIARPHPSLWEHL